MDAGARLAGHLRAHAAREGVVVLGLPRGGVPVAGVVGQRLGLPVDVLVVRKIGMPGHEELAVGAIGPGGASLLDHDLLARAGLTAQALEGTVERERAERERRELAYRGDRRTPALADRVVIVVDDGLATGASMLAAVQAVRASDPARVVAAVPVASPSGSRRVADAADDVVAVLTPPGFAAVGHWYEDFSPVPDQEVRRWLADPPPILTGG